MTHVWLLLPSRATHAGAITEKNVIIITCDGWSLECCRRHEQFGASWMRAATSSDQRAVVERPICPALTSASRLGGTIALAAHHKPQRGGTRFSSSWRAPRCLRL